MQEPNDRYKGRFEKDEESNLWTPAVVKNIHKKSDVDSSPFAQHHTLGPRKDQASGGAHLHKVGDGTSVPLFQGATVSGAKGGNVALASLLAVLVQYGLVDNTTA